MATSRLYVREAASLAPKSEDGSYPVIIIDEGTGSSGVYTAELLKKSDRLFENAPSFINHPINPERPQDRDLNSICGRITGVQVVEREGRTALAGNFKPRKEYASLFEDFADIIGLSIFAAVGEGEELEDGRILVESFLEEDAYRSVDAVIAAGRGGRFERATESLRLIESSLGTPEGAKPAVEASAEEKEGSMEIKELVEAVNALTESLKPVIAFVNESKNANAAEAQAQVDAEAVESAVAEALAAYDQKVVAIEAADLLEPQVADLKARAAKGEDITSAIEQAKAVVEAAKQTVGTPAGYVIEGAGSGYTASDFTLGRGGLR